MGRNLKSYLSEPHCLRMCDTKGSTVFDKMLPVDDNGQNPFFTFLLFP